MAALRRLPPLLFQVATESEWSTFGSDGGTCFQSARSCWQGPSSTRHALRGKFFWQRARYARPRGPGRRCLVKKRPGGSPSAFGTTFPRSTEVLVAIDLPAFVPFAPLAMFDVQLAPHALFYPGAGLACVFLFWWCVGRWLDFRPKPMFTRRAIRIPIVSVGLLVSMGFGAAIWSSYWSHSPVAPVGRLGAAVWCLVGIVVCVTTLKRSFLPRL